MKRKILFSFLIIIMILFPVEIKSSQNASIEETNTLRVAGDNHHPPYEYIDANGIYKGFNVDIMNALSIELGIDIELIPMEWSKAIESLEGREVDFIQGISKTKDREAKFLFVTPTVVNSQSIFVIKETGIITGIEDLVGKRVALQEGDINYEIISEIEDVTIISKENQRQAMEVLLNGEVDAFVGNKLTGIYYLQKLNKSNLVKIVGEPMEMTDYGPATYFGNELLASEVESGLALMKKNGTYDKIYKKWFGEEISNREDFIRAYIMEILIATVIVVCIFIWILLWNKRLKSEVSKRTEELQLVNKDLLLHQKRMHNLAYYDGITSLPNRLYLTETLNKVLEEAIENNSKFALLYFDLDRFKQINDALGHDYGDLVLDLVGKRINRLIRKADVLARIGGDEFLVLMPNIRDEKEAILIANRITEDFQRPFDASTYNLHLTTSIGIAIYPEAGNTNQALMKNADIAMYKAKDRGGNGYYIYSEDLSEKEMDNLILISQIRQAEANNELRLFYQPIINTDNGDIMGMEALIRWENPKEGMVSPGRFIPIAEETGLIIPIGEWVMLTACTQQKNWSDKGYKPIRVSINISAKQFQHNNFIDTVLNIINETGIDPNYLVLEITESTAIIDIEYTLAKLKKLKTLGIKISIDDFGTGYSSLYKVSEMSVDELKIDQSFIKDINSDVKNNKIVKTIIILAKELNLEVIAEGVETKEQLEFLKGNGCNKVQGYYYSKPVPPEEFEKILKLRNDGL
ncbi:MAG: EAL domain-containing protein [Tissierellales bacterium]